MGKGIMKHVVIAELVILQVQRYFQIFHWILIVFWFFIRHIDFNFLFLIFDMYIGWSRVECWIVNLLVFGSNFTQQKLKSK